MEYEIEWDKGPLGLTLCPDFGEDMPPVVGRITQSKSAAYKSKAARGHLLVSINGIDTAGKGYDNIVKLLKNIPRPVYLRFRVPNGFHVAKSKRNAPTQTIGIPSKNQDQYTVLWMDGPLGIILRPDEKNNKLIPCVYKRKRQGRGLGMDKVNIGDQLVAINGQETRYLGLRQSVHMLKTIQKPVVLKFYKMYRQNNREYMTHHISSDTMYTTYKLVWYGGELGLKLKSSNTLELPVISRFTGKGSVEGIELARAGDELVNVNGHSVREKGYQDIVRMMKQSKKPVVLVFRHRRDTAVDDGGPAENPAEDEFHPAENSKYLSSTRSSALSRLMAHEMPRSSKELTGPLYSDLDPQNSDSTKMIQNNSVTDVEMNRVVQESKVLQDALETIQMEAKKYENILQSQNTKKIIATATYNKPIEIVGKQNRLIAELTDAVSGLKRESYSDLEIQCTPLEIERHSLMEGLQNLMNISVVVPKVVCCAECGVTEKESKLDPDEHGQLYCDDCWQHYRAMMDHRESTRNAVEEHSNTDESTSNESINCKSDVNEADTQVQDDTKEENDTIAGSLSCYIEEPTHASSRKAEDFDVLDELTQALLEEEDRARAEGNELLAEKLKIQRLRAREPLSLRSIQSLPNVILRNDPKKDRMCRTLSQKRIIRAEIPFQKNISSPLQHKLDSISDQIDDVKDVNVQVIEESNFALVQQIKEAHSLVQRARLSILPTSEFEHENDNDTLSKDQIQLFKKLTSQLDERMSTVDRLHPPDDSDSSDSDSESDSDGVWI